MPCTSAQLINLACQDAKVPGYIAQAGILLNGILADLCQDYDLELAAKTFRFNFQPGLVVPIGPSIYGGGPYPLPTDYLRKKGDRALTYWISDVPYMPVPIDLDELDAQVQQAGNQSYPSLFTTDLSLQDEIDEGQTSQPGLYVFQPPSGAYAAQLRYFCQMADIVTPETSVVVPWFPNQRYLRKKLTAELMGLSGDDRQDDYDSQADEILDKYLIMKDDPEGRSKKVKFDRRTFGKSASKRLKNTKTIGW